MNISTPLSRNRVILCHFDSYSTALVFARWPDRSLILPAPLPASAQVAAPPSHIEDCHDAQRIMQATVSAYGLNEDDLTYVTDFDQWIQTDEEGLVRIHLLRFTTFEAPSAVIEAHGGTFKPISELRGSAPIELGLMRHVFNLIMGGGGR